MQSLLSSSSAVNCHQAVYARRSSPDAAGESTPASCSAFIFNQGNLHGLVIQCQVVILLEGCHCIVPPFKDHFCFFVRPPAAAKRGFYMLIQNQLSFNVPHDLADHIY